MKWTWLTAILLLLFIIFFCICTGCTSMEAHAPGDQSKCFQRKVQSQWFSPFHLLALQSWMNIYIYTANRAFNELYLRMDLYTVKGSSSSVCNEYYACAVFQVCRPRLIASLEVQKKPPNWSLYIMPSKKEILRYFL